jgi:hypothetical protein
VTLWIILAVVVALAATTTVVVRRRRRRRPVAIAPVERAPLPEVLVEEIAPIPTLASAEEVGLSERLGASRASSTGSAPSVAGS